MVCPEKKEIKNENYDIPVKVNIKSLNFEKIIPAQFELSDKILKMLKNGDEIILTNFSSKYITIENISFYYNNQISDFNEDKIELPPQCNISKDFRKSFNINWKSLKFSYMTRKKAESTTIDFGFALKYKILDLNKEQTIYKTHKFNFLDLIKE
jgi:hypothetical protein